MSKEVVLAIIKPDVVKHKNAGKVLSMYENSKHFIIKAMRMAHLTEKEAEGFYAVHKERPFFRELVDFMISGPCILMALEGSNAVALHREFIGATNPAAAAEGTVRKLYGSNIGENAVHGSDSVENGQIEVNYFFPNMG